MSRNWEDLGIRWEASAVMRQAGDHASDRRTLGNAQIPVLVDTDKAVAANLGPAILKGVNGTSWRVMAQDVCRGLLEKGVHDVDATREKVYARLLSIRQTSAPIVVTKRPLPNGETYTGSDESEFRSLYAAALVDIGLPAEAAMEAATKISF